MAINKVNHRVGATIFAVLAIGVLVFGLLSLTFARPVYWMACMGALAYCAAKMSWKKNKFDNQNKQFDYLKFMDHEWDNVLMSIVGIMLFTDYMLDLTDLFSNHVTEVKFYQLYYYLPGAIGDRIYNAICWGISKIPGVQFKHNYTPETAEDSKPVPPDEVP